MMTLQMDSRVGQILYSYRYDTNSYSVPFNSLDLTYLLNLVPKTKRLKIRYEVTMQLLQKKKSGVLGCNTMCSVPTFLTSLFSVFWRVEEYAPRKKKANIMPGGPQLQSLRPAKTSAFIYCDIQLLLPLTAPRNVCLQKPRPLGSENLLQLFPLRIF